MAEQKKSDLAELGEFGLIHHLTKDIELKNKSSIKGIGDDAAILNHAEKNTVITADILVEGVHFDLSYVPLKHLGYKSVIVNLSDVYAMNARPTQIIVSLAISNRFPLEALEELYKGIRLACKNYNVDLVGGDTTSSMKGMIISITAIGESEKGTEVLRNTARPGDLICVSGDLGAAYAGLQLLEREKYVFLANPEIQPVLSGYEYIVSRQLKPEARKDVPEIFEKIGLQPTSMIDISDGLSSELLHICNQSKTGCNVYEDKIPIASETIAFAKELNIDPTICAMNGGEDYELLFTIRQEDYEKLKNIDTFSVIGHITDKENELWLTTRDGSHVKIEAQGWNALKTGS